MSKVVRQTHGSWQLVPDPQTGDIKLPVTQTSPRPHSVVRQTISFVLVLSACRRREHFVECAFPVENSQLRTVTASAI